MSEKFEKVKNVSVCQNILVFDLSHFAIMTTCIQAAWTPQVSAKPAGSCYPSILCQFSTKIRGMLQAVCLSQASSAPIHVEWGWGSPWSSLVFQVIFCKVLRCVLGWDDMSPHIKLFTQIVKLISLTLKNKYYDKKTTTITIDLFWQVASDFLILLYMYIKCTLSSLQLKSSKCAGVTMEVNCRQWVIKDTDW